MIWKRDMGLRGHLLRPRDRQKTGSWTSPQGLAGVSCRGKPSLGLRTEEIATTWRTTEKVGQRSTPMTTSLLLLLDALRRRNHTELGEIGCGQPAGGEGGHERQRGDVFVAAREAGNRGGLYGEHGVQNREVIPGRGS